MLVKNYLERLPKSQLINLVEFIVTENFKHHSNNKLHNNYKNDVNSIYKEELNFYENSEIFITKDHTGNILGAIRLLKWNYTDVLPLQKIFGINPLLALNQPNTNNIYHIGRFAVKKDARDINLFKRLLMCVAKLICNHKRNVAFAECDSKLLRILKLLGVKAMVIGESVNYLGSETIPIAMTYDGIIDFYNKNKHLVDNNSNQTSNHYLISENKVTTPMAYSA
jgi:N-acyl-L-homoserine lactone synthetase